MSKTATYNGLFRKVWTRYKEEWCAMHGVPVTKRPEGLICVSDFEKNMFQDHEFVKKYLSAEEFESYLKELQRKKVLYVPIPIDWANDSDDTIKRKSKENQFNLERLDILAHNMESLVGRFLLEEVPLHENQGCFAIYQIVCEYKNQVVLRLCTDIGEEWDIPAWGKETKISKALALEKLKNRDIPKEKDE